MDQEDFGLLGAIVLLIGVIGLVAYLVAGALTVSGPELQEQAVVLDTIYEPSRHSSGTGVGLTTGGNMAVVSTSSTTPAKYATVFQCQHGKFIIERQNVWAAVTPGDTVVVHYAEKFKKYIKRGQFAGYDFLFISRGK